MFYTRRGSLLGMLLMLLCTSITPSIRFQGYVFDNVGATCSLYPSVGLRSPNENIRANFGQGDFLFDICAHVLQRRTVIWQSIQQSALQLEGSTSSALHFDVGARPIPNSDSTQLLHLEPSREVKGRIDSIIRAYLIHQGYSKTARALNAILDARTQVKVSGNIVADNMDLDRNVEASETALQSRLHPIDPDDLCRRVQVIRAVQQGDIDLALDLSRRHFPAVLSADDGLILFKLRCRKLIELIMQGSEQLKRGQSQEQPKHGDCGEGVAWRTSRRAAGARSVMPDYATAASDADGVFEMEMDPTIDAHSVDGLYNGFGCDLPEGGSVSGLNGYTGVAADKGKLRQSSPVGEVRQSPTSQLNVFDGAIAYGQCLQADYKDDKREGVAMLFKRAASLMAFSEVAEPDRETAALVTQEARDALAADLNKAILGA
jgi:hypothetical protein